MKHLKEYLMIFVVQVLAGVNAGTAFSFFDERYTASMVASTGFICVAIINFYFVSKNGSWKKQVLAWVNGFYFFAIVMPLFITRYLDASNEPLESVIGIPGPLFHSISTKVYAVLILSTILDAFSFYKSRNKQTSGS